MKSLIWLNDQFGSSSRRVVVAMAVCLLGIHAEAALTHRYSFNGDANDSIAGANGTLQNNVTISGGAAHFDQPGGVAGPDSDYIELPPGLISNYTSVTFELWVDVADNGIWPEIYAFGRQNAAGQGANMVMFCPHSGGGTPDFRMSYAQASPGYTDEYLVNGGDVLDNVGPVSVTCVYDPPNNSMSLYTNGTLVRILSPVTTRAKRFSLTNVINSLSWLGRSLYNGDAAYNGTIDEFRLYDTALTPLQIYVNDKAGPDTVVTNIAINSLTWSANTNMVVGSRQSTTVTFNTADYGSVTLAGATEPTYSSSDPSVVKVTAQGQLFALKVGSATVSAVFNGTTNSAVLAVSPPKLIHRYSFDTDAKDSVGNADGTMVGGATVSGGSLVLPGGTTSSDPGAAYLDLPNGLLTNLTAMTFEGWVTDNDSGPWARVWDFGNSAGGEDASDTGKRFVFLALPNGGGNVQATIHVDDRGGDASVTAARPPAGEQAHIVWATDTANQTSSLYINGSLVAVNTSTTVAPLDIGETLNDWLGRSQYGNDSTFSGSISEFRIYDGAILPLQVSLDAAAGPDRIITDPGALVALRLSLGTNNVYYGGVPVQVLLLADYASLTNVNVTAAAGVQFQSSDQNVLTIDNRGLATGTATGSATITASYGGMTATLPVTVSNLPGYTQATLVHRYSFSETAGSTTVKDSVGTADGTILGTGAVFNGQGQLSLPGGGSSSDDPSTIAGYVDLPNHIINVLTDLTVEAWVTWSGSGSWQRIFDFGTSASGEDISDGSGNYLFLAPQGAANLTFSVRDPDTGAEPAPLIAPGPLATNLPVYLAVVYNYTANIARLYSNTVVVASSTAPVAITGIDDVNNWLGRSQWPDPMFQGTYDEFRIWNGVLLPDEINAHIAAGPDSLTPPSGGGPKLAVSLSGNNLAISWPATASDFALESSSKLGTGANWTPVTQSPTTANGVNTVTIPIASDTQFFRLRK